MSIKFSRLQNSLPHSLNLVLLLLLRPIDVYLCLLEAKVLLFSLFIQELGAIIFYIISAEGNYDFSYPIYSFLIDLKKNSGDNNSFFSSAEGF